jgi:PAS domain S-box-containing protein
MYRSPAILSVDADGTVTQANAAAWRYLGGEDDASSEDLPEALMSTPWQETTYVVAETGDTITLAELAGRTHREGTTHVSLRKSPDADPISVTASRTKGIGGRQAITFILSPEPDYPAEASSSEEPLLEEPLLEEPLLEERPPEESLTGSEVESGDERHGEVDGQVDGQVDAATLLDSLPELTVALDGEGRIMALSESWADFGEENDAVPSQIGPGTNYLNACLNGSRVAGTNAQRAYDGIRAVLNREVDLFKMEYPCDSPTEKRWFRMRAIPLKRDAGGAIVSHLDITESKKREERLRLMEAAVDNAVDLVIITEAAPIDKPGPRIVYVNDAVERYTGYSEEELIGATPRIFQGEATGREGLDRIREALENGNEVRETVLNYTKDGTPFWNEIYISPIADEDGWFTHWVSVQRDVTKQRETAQILARQTAHLGGIIESAMDAIITVDQPQCIRAFNPAAERMFGYDATEVVGKPLDILIPNGKEDVHRELVEAFTTSEDVHRRMGRRNNVKGRRKDGTIFPAEASVSKVNVADEVMYVAILRDVTEREKRERELERAIDKAEEANRLKSALLANMNHEVRTPLTSITGFSEIMMGDLPEPHARHARLIHQSSHRLMQTLDAVMQFSQLEAGAEALSFETFDLRTELRFVAGQIRPAPEAKHVDLDIDGLSEPVSGCWDRTAVRRIVMNLLENAIKFSDKDTTVRLRVMTVQDDARPVEIRVQDAGIGIAEEAQERIFDPFVQESQGLRRRFEGTGLGLSIVQRLTHALGGTVDVESERGEGATFSVRLPMDSSNHGLMNNSGVTSPSPARPDSFSNR